MTWTDRLVGSRMALDREFGDRVAESSLSHQEWNLVMTATEFRVENADDPEQARMVGDTSKLSSVVPEMKRVASEQPNAGGQQQQSGGLMGSLKSALGMGDGDDTDDADLVETAETLVDEYTTRLQTQLEERGRWEEIRQEAAEEQARP